MAAATKKRISTPELNVLVQAKFASPTWGLLQNVGDGTGAGCNRWIDWLAMGLWPSRGLTLIGIECKVSRTDWLKELKNPAKADAIAQYCDEFYVAAGDSGIVAPDELPRNWGLLVADGKSLHTEIMAKPLTPKAITRDFLAAIFRRCTEQTADKVAIATAEQSGYERGIRSGEFTRKELAELEKRVAVFEKTAGIHMGTFSHTYISAAEFGKAFNAAMHPDPNGALGATKRARQDARRTIAQLQSLLDQTSWAEPSEATALL